jgi:hypothetical protein
MREFMGILGELDVSGKRLKLRGYLTQIGIEFNGKGSSGKIL